MAAHRDSDKNCHHCDLGRGIDFTDFAGERPLSGTLIVSNSQYRPAEIIVTDWLHISHRPFSIQVVYAVFEAAQRQRLSVNASNSMSRLGS